MLNRFSDRQLFLVMLVASVLLLLGCWNSEFLTYDDADHINLNTDVVGHTPLLSLFRIRHDVTYFPVTTLSYRLDLWLFAWMVPAVGTWAPGVRLMTALYHGAGACMLWLALRELGVRRGAAYFIAFVFACHPMACETVCWASERKNALAGMFGFAAVWAWLKYKDRPWRLAATGGLWTLALMSKPSALGLLPLLLVLDVMILLAPGKDGAARRARSWRDGAGLVLRWMPLVAIAVTDVGANLVGHGGTLVQLPGGSLFSTLLTDVEILARYIQNAFVPSELSFAYCVEPICSLTDARLWMYGLPLAGAVAVSVWLAENRARALLGWFWFVSALGPNLNLIAIPQLMQDRYLYLSLPGLLLVAVETWSGLAARAKISAPTTLLVASGYAGVLLLAAILRGGVYTDVFTLFYDAALKQPQSALARENLAVAYTQQGTVLRRAGRNEEAAEAFRNMGKELLKFMECPDAPRQIFYGRMALETGRYLSERQHDILGGRRYLKIAMEASSAPAHVRAEARQRYDALENKP